MDYLNYNKQAWNHQVKQANKWTIPVTPKQIAEAKGGEWEIVLTPSIPVPASWFGELKGKKVLCLASGGGQQGPILAAAGAEVVVFDLSDEQLNRDREVAEREQLNITTIQGDMANLEIFENNSFDLIFHPVSNCFIPDVLPVWKECYRILRTGGTLLAGFANPVLYLFEDEEEVKDIRLEVKYSIPYSDMIHASDERKKWFAEKNYPLEFGHTLEDQIGGQLKAGFVISGFFEDRFNDPGHPLDKIIPLFIATKADKL